MKNINTISLFLVSLSFIYGCSAEDVGAGNCEGQISNLINQMGQPKEINKYDSSNYHSHTYWYWCRGFARDFTWGDNVYNCEVNDYAFSPIC